MPKTFRKSGEIEAAARSAMEKYHPGLSGAGVTIHALMAFAEDKGGQVVALKKSGYPVAALVKVASLEDRARGAPDVKLTVDDLAWNCSGRA